MRAWLGSSEFRFKRGVVLPAVMAFIVLILILYYQAIDRTVAERRLVLDFYYGNVARDLAESGVALAAAELAAGTGGREQYWNVGAFRGLAGTVRVTVAPGADGQYEIISVGELSDRGGGVVRAAGLTVRGHFHSTPSGPRFRPEQWLESTLE